MSDPTNLPTRAELLWHKAEIAARKYCGSHGYEQEPMKLARIIYELLCAETLSTSAAVRDAIELSRSE